MAWSRAIETQRHRAIEEIETQRLYGIGNIRYIRDSEIQRLRGFGGLRLWYVEDKRLDIGRELCKDSYYEKARHIDWTSQERNQ